MNVFSHFRDEIIAAIGRMAASGEIPAGLDVRGVTAEPPRDPGHGDVATNAAMVLARPAAMRPREIATRLAAELEQIDGVASVEIAGPGFINLRLHETFWHERLREVLRTGTAYGDSALGAGRPVNVEYVSANPTGPLHVGHGRGAVFGDVLASLLAKAGFAVTREYYVNDAGAQVDILARSVHLRYREALGEDVPEVPEGLYPGEYLKEVGAALAREHGDAWVGRPESEWLEPVRAAAIDAMMGLIRDDLEALGIRPDVFTSERSLVAAGRVDEVLSDLQERGFIYTGVLEPPKGKLPDDWEPRPQTLFRSTAFGDDVDRPLRKSDGDWTYFATDIAYHLDKYRRGFTSMIDVWGADHGGYVKRMAAAVKAVTGGEGDLDVKLCQLVRILRAGELVRMSKRAGDFVTLREVVEEVGKGVVRFIMLTRKNDAPLDFDLTKVLEQSRDNPVFYVQYAHARVCSVLRNAGELFPGRDFSDVTLAGADPALLRAAEEQELIRMMATWPRIVEGAAEAHEPHRLAFYLYDLASQLHALWTKGRDEPQLRFLIEDDPELSRSRLAMVRGVGIVIASGLGVFGIEPAEEMR